jgi:SAM-dependent methyltransferase
VQRVSAASADLPIVPRLSHGVAVFGPGEIQRAVQRADDALYERKGVLLPAASGGRIILTREGRSALRQPGDDRAQPQPGAFSAGFGPEFEAYFRAQYVRALEQAREFVDLVDPEPGTAVVEVGAGSGRITFDGGLAERIGPKGQLLVTDPSGPQLLEARKHAEERDLPWVRFVRAPAEELPLASGTVDLVLGGLFLHFTEPVRALQEMARVVRPGGRVAISAGLEHGWPPAWQDALAPVRRAVEAEGFPWRHFLLQRGQLEDLMTAAGLTVEQFRLIGPDTLEFSSADFTVALGRQIRLVRLLLRGCAADRLVHIQEEFERRVHEGFQRHGPRAWTIADVYLVSAVARRPG